VRAFSREALGSGETDAAGCAGDECDLVVEPIFSSHRSTQHATPNANIH